MAAAILEGRYCDGDILPSVRAFAAEVNANPLTVGKAYQSLIEAGIVQTRRGVGIFVSKGGRKKLRLMETARFLEEEWPAIRREMVRLDLDLREMLEMALGKKAQARLSS